MLVKCLFLKGFSKFKVLPRKRRMGTIHIISDLTLKSAEFCKSVAKSHPWMSALTADTAGMSSKVTHTTCTLESLI